MSKDSSARRNRRDFIKTTAATAAALASDRLHLRPAAQTLTAPSADPLVIELANDALNAARKLAPNVLKGGRAYLNEKGYDIVDQFGDLRLSRSWSAVDGT